MSKKPSNYKSILKLLDELHKEFPTISLGQHLSTALDGYGDLWAVSDKEFLFALEKYIATAEISTPMSTEEELAKIIEDGKNLDKMILDDKYDDEEENYD